MSQLPLHVTELVEENRYGPHDVLAVKLSLDEAPANAIR
jgi:hypothetical protein